MSSLTVKKPKKKKKMEENTTSLYGHFRQSKTDGIQITMCFENYKRHILHPKKKLGNGNPGRLTTMSQIKIVIQKTLQ